MKLTRIFLFLAIATLAFGCSSDDDGVDVFNYNKNNLTGTYLVSEYTKREVKTQEVDGFDVVTTTVSTGDTFNLTVIFDSNNVQTMNGTYRINEVKTQGGQKSESAYIVVVENEKKNYSVDAGAMELKIGKNTFKVSRFNRTGFKISREDTTGPIDGDHTVVKEEWLFKR